MELDQLKLQLLELLLMQDVSAISQPRQLTEEDWATVLAMLKEHRLGPLLHWRLSRDCRHLSVPQSVQEFCAASFKASTMRSLMIQRELLLVHRILESAGIAHVTLKGSWLAYHAYPQPGLRPLRDVDILVPRQEVLRAFQALLEGGCKRVEKYDGSPEAFVKEAKHMPPMWSPSGEIYVELHLRLYHPDDDKSNEFELSEAPDFWQRLITNKSAGISLTYLPPTELLLHLIVHAVYDHQFNNGPLLISDMGYLLAKHPIDWPRFWDLAQQGGHASGAALALHLLEHYWGRQPIDWPKDTAFYDLQQMPLACAAELMLRSFKSSADVNLAQGMQGQLGLNQKLAFLWRKIFPRRSMIAAAYPVSENSVLVYAWYPVRWWRLLTQRLPAFLGAQQQTRLKSEVSQLAQLNRWLRDPIT